MRARSAVTMFRKHEQDEAAVSRFSVRVAIIGGIAVLRCSGRLCFQGEAMLLAEVAKQYLNSGADLVIELEGLEILDSAGIGELVLISMQAQALGRNVCIACAPERIRKLLELTNVASLFEFFGSLDAALSACSMKAA